MTGYEKVIAQSSPDLCVVVGDVNSTAACAISGKKMGVQLAHIEAGIRSGDRAMPEEINRILTDSITDWFFTTSRNAGDNLRREGADPRRIFFVGNLMIDNLLMNLTRLKKPDFWDQFNLSPQGYLVLTLHRPVTADRPEVCESITRAVSSNSRGLPVVFPAHPRTAKTIAAIISEVDNVLLVDPLPYLEFNYLVKTHLVS